MKPLGGSDVQTIGNECEPYGKGAAHLDRVTRLHECVRTSCSQFHLKCIFKTENDFNFVFALPLSHLSWRDQPPTYNEAHRCEAVE